MSADDENRFRPKPGRIRSDTPRAGKTKSFLTQAKKIARQQRQEAEAALQQSAEFVQTETGLPPEFLIHEADSPRAALRKVLTEDPDIKIVVLAAATGRGGPGPLVGAIAKEPQKYFPYGIYAVPEISTVGMSEQDVKEKKIPYECGIARFRETSRGHIMGLDSGLMKMIFSLKTRRLLGVHILGEGATELIHIGQAVLNLKGTIDYFIENTFNYPTLAEAYKIAALDAWNRMPLAE